MRVLCVGRHPYLSEHLCRYFDELGLDTTGCVGLDAALDQIASQAPDAVICDYDLLATIPLANWESDPALASTPVIAVSLTRHPGEAHVLDVNSMAGFLYLPTLKPEDAHRVLATVRKQRGDRTIDPPSVLPWPVTRPVASAS